MDTNLNMQRMPIDQLKPAKYNPRKDLKPGDPAYEKIRRSLHDFGYVDPIVWNEVTGNIVGGHQRYKVLKAEGATEVDCVVVQEVHDDDCDIDPDEVQPYVQAGDIWTLGKHRMMCGDSTDPDAVDLLMDGTRANLVVTDPPYNVAYESADGKSIQNDSMADEQFFRRVEFSPGF